MWVASLMAAAALAPCPKAATCNSFTVPLDHSGAVAGQLTERYAQVPATGTRTGTLVLLSGGPGQAAIPLTESFVGILGPLREHYDFVFPDQRGTGDSGAVECHYLDGELENAGLCAGRTGAKRTLMTTAETASDLEDLRVVLGVERLTLLGVSYGTMVATEYARRFPNRVAAVVLDSAVQPGGYDIFDRVSTQTLPRVLREVCRAACRRTVGDPVDALRRAVTRVQRGPVRGAYVLGDGRTKSIPVSEALLLRVLKDTDQSPMLRSELPAALESLAHGDAAALMHADDFYAPESDETTVINDARLLATVCTEAPAPWAPENPTAPVTGSEQFAPFSLGAGLNASIEPLCAEWPATARAALATGPLPDVPTLILSGREDLRTPLEGARLTAAQFPHATLVDVAATGHSVLRNELSGCGRDAVLALLRARPVRQCSPRPKPFVPARAYVPADLRDVGAVGARGRAGRTLGAVYYTLDGVWQDRANLFGWYDVRGTTQIPGLRRGYSDASRTVLTLHGVEVIRGVRVSGRIDDHRTGRLSVRGPQTARGTLTFRRGRVTGTLGGVLVND